MKRGRKVDWDYKWSECNNNEYMEMELLDECLNFKYFHTPTDRYQSR